MFEKVVDHVDAQIKQCPICDATVKGRFPADLHGPLQWVNGLKAFVINLLACQMVACREVGKERKLRPESGAKTADMHAGDCDC